MDIKIHEVMIRESNSDPSTVSSIHTSAEMLSELNDMSEEEYLSKIDESFDELTLYIEETGILKEDENLVPSSINELKLAYIHDITLKAGLC